MVKLQKDLWYQLFTHFKLHPCKIQVTVTYCASAVPEIIVSHWLLSEQFQHLTNHNLFWLAKFPVHFQWDSNQ